MNYRNALILALATVFVSQNAEAQKIGDLVRKKTEKLTGSQLELFEEQPMDFEQYANNAGKIVFANVDFERELPESKYITSYTLGEKLSFRAYMKNAPANAMMLQVSESGEYKNRDISSWRNTFASSYVIFNLYLDGELIANTTHARNFDNDEFSTLPTLVGDLKDDSGVYFGEEMYERLLRKVDAVTPGVHKLKLELLPIFSGSAYDDFQFEPIASGEIDLIVPEGDAYITMENCIPKNLQSKTSDKSLESELTSIYLQYQPSGYEFVSLWLPTANWNIKRAEYTDRVIEKSRSAVVVSKNENGELFYDSYFFKRVFDGVEYEPTVINAYITGNGEVEAPRNQISQKCHKFIEK